MDWEYYGPIIPQYIIDNHKYCADVAAAAFAVGYPNPEGYASGLLIGSYPLGAGRFLLNTLNILEQIDRHLVADRLLLNMIHAAAQ